MLFKHTAHGFIRCKIARAGHTAGHYQPLGIGEVGFTHCHVGGDSDSMSSGNIEIRGYRHSFCIHTGTTEHVDHSNGLNLFKSFCKEYK